MLWRTDAQILQSRRISGVQLFSTQVYGQEVLMRRKRNENTRQKRIKDGRIYVNVSQNSSASDVTGYRLEGHILVRF